MDIRGKWMIPAACVAAAMFIIWGFTGEGTAKKLLPEKEPSHAAAVSTDSTPAVGEDSGAVMKYDAARYRRGKPLQDPFHAKAIAEAKKEDKKKEVSSSALQPVAKKEVSSGKSRETARPERKHSDIPELKGIMAYRDDRRAIIELNGETFVLKEGERAGVWTVSGIYEKKVILYGARGTLELGTR